MSEGLVAMQVSAAVRALVGLAEDGVDAVEALDGGAAGAGFALVAGGEGGVHEVVAAGALEEVAAGGGHVAELRGWRRRAGPARAGGSCCDDAGWLARSELRTSGADGDAAVGLAVDLGEAEVVDVDEGGGVLDAVLHEVDEVGAAAEELCALWRRRRGWRRRGRWRAGRRRGSCSGLLMRDGADGGDDVGVGAAAADVAAHAFADLVVGELRGGAVWPVSKQTTGELAALVLRRAGRRRSRSGRGCSSRTGSRRARGRRPARGGGRRRWRGLRWW